MLRLVRPSTTRRCCEVRVERRRRKKECCLQAAASAARYELVVVDRRGRRLARWISYLSLTSLVLVFIPDVRTCPSVRVALEAPPPHWLVSTYVNFCFKVVERQYLISLLSSQFGHGLDAALFVSVDELAFA